MILFYRWLTNIFYPILIIFIFVRKIFNKEDKLRYKEKIFPSYFNISKKRGKKLFWFHAASVGELRSILPILEELDNKDFEFLITTVTLSSGNLAKEEFKNFKNLSHRYLPIDSTFLMERFLNSWKPNAIFLVDSEIWPNLILIAKKLKIPIALINDRMTQKSFQRWFFAKKFAKIIFSSLNLCLASSVETKDFLLKLGAREVLYTGNIKFICPKKIVTTIGLNENFLSKNIFWVAASTHRDEETLCLQTHLKIKKKFKDIITVIAPRHVERVKEIKLMCDKLNLRSIIIDKGQAMNTNYEIFIINFYGGLNQYFKYSKSTFVGKSTLKRLEKTGGQNPIDAARFGCKIYHGPFINNFKEIYEILHKNKISEKIHDSNELSSFIMNDLNDKGEEFNKSELILEELSKKISYETMKNIKRFLSNAI